MWYVFLFLVLAAASIDPYHVLGVDRSADDKTIKSAYRQLSKQYHPDKNSSPDAHDKFIEIGEAYDILSSAEKKRNYDQYGDPEGPGMGGMGGMGGMADFFNQFHGHPGHRGKPRGQDTNVELEISLKDFYQGREMDFGLNMHDICESCTGSGSADGKRKPCSRCGGSGMVMMRQQLGPFVHTTQAPCDACRGAGSTIENLCKTCHGAGKTENTRNYNLFCAPGTPRNYVHTMAGEGHQSPDWEAGDLHFRFKEKPDENWGFRRIGNHLYRTEVLSAKEALLGGWTRHIAKFNGETVELSRKKGELVKDGKVDVFPGHGMPIFGDDQYGSLYVEYRVLPSRRDPMAKDEL